ncbi:MAG: UDP-3-O-acyl-N-acetylglucosamine deacetylase, partial [Pseudomonadota bacterium]|nr:UDP-3-O-acyl-N-acetylglucosamine deacetylase [Pseudomonadota bacterium]
MPVRNDHQERTLIAPAIIAGVGVHTGRRVRLAVRPAPAGTGIVFVRTDVADLAETQALCDKTFAAFGACHFALFNAGINTGNGSSP